MVTAVTAAGVHSGDELAVALVGDGDVSGRGLEDLEQAHQHEENDEPDGEVAEIDVHQPCPERPARSAQRGRMAGMYARAIGRYKGGTLARMAENAKDCALFRLTRRHGFVGCGAPRPGARSSGSRRDPNRHAVAVDDAAVERRRERFRGSAGRSSRSTARERVRLPAAADAGRGHAGRRGRRRRAAAQQQRRGRSTAAPAGRSVSSAKASDAACGERPVGVAHADRELSDAVGRRGRAPRAAAAASRQRTRS